MPTSAVALNVSLAVNHLRPKTQSKTLSKTLSS
jgi:hypothetical protein